MPRNISEGEGLIAVIVGCIAFAGMSAIWIGMGVNETTSCGIGLLFGLLIAGLFCWFFDNRSGRALLTHVLAIN